MTYPNAIYATFLSFPLDKDYPPILLLWWVELDLKSISSHTSLVLLHQRLAVGLCRIIGFGEEHAVVAGGFFFFADAAWLSTSVSMINWIVAVVGLGRMTDLGFFGLFGGGC
jgi:hypothetical protein